MGQKHIDDCLSLETGEAKDCRCADEERHYWWLARLSALGFIIQGLINFFLAGSVALFADMVHQLFDGAENTTSAIVSRKARATVDENRLRKIGGHISAVLIIGASLWILNETLERLHSPEQISAQWMLVGGLAGLLVGLIQFKKHATAHEEHKNLTHWWQYWHLVTDIAGSGAVIVGSVFYLDGYALADAIASFCVIGLIWIRVSLKFWRDIKENKKTPENPKRAHYHAR